MKVVGVLLLLIAFGAFSIYGMSTTNELIQSGDATIDDNDSMYQSYTTSREITTSSWGMASNGIWIIAIILVIVVLGGAVAIITR